MGIMQKISAFKTNNFVFMKQLMLFGIKRLRYFCTDLCHFLTVFFLVSHFYSHLQSTGG